VLKLTMPENEQTKTRAGAVFGGNRPDDDLLEEVRGRVAQPLHGRELRGELAAGGLFLVAAGVLAAVSPGESQPLLALTLVIAYALASHIRFEVATGFTVPTQLALVPMLLLTEPALVPLMVVAGNILGDLPEYLRGRRHASRALISVGDAWHAVGPTIVLLAAGSPEASLEHWPVYLLALLAQFAFDFAATAARELYEYGIRVRDQVTDALWIWAVDGLLSPIALVASTLGQQQGLVFLTLLPLLGLLWLFAHERRSRLDQALELRNAYLGTTILLADLIEGDDEYTGAHSQGVVAMSVRVAEELDLDQWQRRRTEYAARLHDVGKIAIPKEIINKPGPLDADEWTLMRQHTVEGERMLSRVGGALNEIGAIVRGSHERWDGGGYPDGLAGEAIPIEARIVACCDAFDAMTTDRSYRSALPLETAVAEVRESAGSQFDPQVADALIRVVRRESAELGEKSVDASRDLVAGRADLG
jgi:HD-GYP domain-containing protein (c-di-GMP phosphodiesterase class II)